MDEAQFVAALVKLGIPVSVARHHASREIYDAFCRRLLLGVSADDALRPEHKQNLLRKMGVAAVDTVTCERCFNEAPYVDDKGETCLCRNCGDLVEVDGVWTPVLPPQKTGYCVDNTHPLAGLRTPAKFWIPGAP